MATVNEVIRGLDNVLSTGEKNEFTLAVID